MGFQKIRLTGGEPLVRSELWKLVELLAAIEGLDDIALTTNGVLLEQQAQSLFDAGLHRLNVSLDTVDQAMFEKITRRKGLQKVLDGIAKAKQVGFKNIRVNAVSIAQLTETEIVPLAQFARAEGLELRFIEFMPLDAEGNWTSKKVLSGETVRNIIGEHVGKLIPAERTYTSQPAIDFEYENGGGRIGFINPVSQPFCGQCDRLRLAANGQLYNCLFSDAGWDFRALIRENGSDDEIRQQVRDCVAKKKAGHGMDSDKFQRPGFSMYQIGG